MSALKSPFDLSKTSKIFSILFYLAIYKRVELACFFTFHQSYHAFYFITFYYLEEFGVPDFIENSA